MVVSGPAAAVAAASAYHYCTTTTAAQTGNRCGSARARVVHGGYALEGGREGATLDRKNAQAPVSNSRAGVPEQEASGVLEAAFISQRPFRTVAAAANRSW